MPIAKPVTMPLITTMEKSKSFGHGGLVQKILSIFSLKDITNKFRSDTCFGLSSAGWASASQHKTSRQSTSRASTAAGSVMNSHL